MSHNLVQTNDSFRGTSDKIGRGYQQALGACLQRRGGGLNIFFSGPKCPPKIACPSPAQALLRSHKITRFTPARFAEQQLDGLLVGLPMFVARKPLNFPSMLGNNRHFTEEGFCQGPLNRNNREGATVRGCTVSNGFSA